MMAQTEMESSGEHPEEIFQMTSETAKDPQIDGDLTSSASVLTNINNEDVYENEII